ncbi:NAD(P)/FAD-dependent oxidoreductase [Congregibacter brevis]|uniref:Pyridine nucleotide-disulfide oxidoreductase domain-containing protein 2 n=1 Tax=Congregibacter brevis TaxID=3081201 RepID=A0ABZ0IB65_9GAMM|nr:NAD(P)/FAD-dependent oxidoreductase [Congregibacter sp. IMCC45268]
MSDYDSIVIGGGHNGLICATMLARIGHRVLLLEANDKLGGLAADREFAPGFHAPVAQTLYGLQAAVIKDLRLEDYGFVAGDPPLNLVALSTEEPPITIGDTALSGAQANDTLAFEQYRSQLKTFAGALAPFWGKTMPRIGMGSLKDLMTFGHMGLKLRLLGREDMLEFFRVATLPMRDLVDEYFESDSLKAALCWDGMVGTKMAPRSPNQAVLTLLNRMAGTHEGQHVVPTGGMAEFIAVLERSARSAGVEIRTDAAVKKITIDGDDNGQRCSGVRLADGSEISAERVISSADPKTTFLRLVGAANLEIEFTNRIRRLRCDGYVAKVNLALTDLPVFTGIDRPDGRMVLAPNMDTIEFAYDNAKYGELPEQPVLEVLIPSLHQTGLAPKGQHVLNANVMYVPGQLKGGWTDDARSTLMATIMEALEQYAPGITALVSASELLTPLDLEAQYHVSGGHWHHAEPAVDQLLMMRPTYEAAQYRTPIHGLFLCGAGSHPGGDVNGNAGRNAAREILA